MTMIYRLGVFGMLLFGIVLGGANVFMFFDTLSALLIFGLVLSGAIGWFSRAQTLGAIKAGLRSTPIAHADAVRYIAVLRTIRHIAIASGFSGFCIGSILMLSSMDDPAHIGPACAVLLLTSIYAAVIAELVIGPLISGIVARVEGVEGASA